LNGWRNNYGGQSIFTKANDGVTFATLSEDKEETKRPEKRGDMFQMQDSWAL